MAAQPGSRRVFRIYGAPVLERRGTGAGWFGLQRNGAFVVTGCGRHHCYRPWCFCCSWPAASCYPGGARANTRDMITFFLFTGGALYSKSDPRPVASAAGRPALRRGTSALPFVTRDEDWKIAVVFHEPEEGAQNEVPAVNEDLVEFMGVSVRQVLDATNG